ncbi:MAG: hypothetical protein JWN22_246 [Nocardioides sp.]|jgi:hypothetical protein|nr:hypothetical protein [Nocardioides sp.]
MEIVLGVGFVILVVWAASRGSKKQSNDNPVASHFGATAAQPTHAQLMAQIESGLRAEIDRSVERDFGRLSAVPDLRRVETKRPPDHRPPLPTSLGKEAWSPRTQQLEVAGEWYRAANLRALFAKHAKVSESGTEIRLRAVLVPDPTNPFDGKAVAVYVDGMHVGYMERPDAKKYHHHIAKLSGGELVVTSRQWLRASVDDTWARVTLSLPLPDQLECPNPFGAECVSLPPGSTIQVTKEEDYMGAPWGSSRSIRERESGCGLPPFGHRAAPALRCRARRGRHRRRTGGSLVDHPDCQLPPSREASRGRGPAGGLSGIPSWQFTQGGCGSSRPKGT